MPTGSDPKAPRIHDTGIVHFQCSNRCATASGEANNLDAVGAPDEMVCPVLRARVEQWRSFTGFGIYCLGQIAFVDIAGSAGAT